jgi:hypothetical protein
VRWTEKDPDVRDVAEGELWVGAMGYPLPHVVLATRKGEDVHVQRFRPADARDMGEQLIAFAEKITPAYN